MLHAAFVSTSNRAVKLELARSHVSSLVADICIGGDDLNLRMALGYCTINVEEIRVRERVNSNLPFS